LRDARELAGATVAAIGPGTAAELRRHGIEADVVPERSVAEALVEALADVPVDGRRVLVARASEARGVLPDALRERGADGGVAAPPSARVVSIGPVTSDAARELGLEVHVEAQRHDIDGLVEALLDDVGTVTAR